MGLFGKMKEATYEADVAKIMESLVEKDGNIHVLMINSFSKWLNQTFGAETKYTTQIEMCLQSMQEKGYEIIDVKFNSVQGQGLSGQMEGFHTLITYK